MQATVQFAPFFFVVFNLVLFLGMPEVLAYSAQKLHPTSDNIPTITDPDFILRPPGNILERGEDFYSSLAITDTVIIGVAEGERYEMLGDIWDIEIDADGRIFILDRALEEVLIYDSDGSYLGGFGGSGSGPGEFTKPGDLALSDSGRIAVVIGKGIHVFERQKNGQFIYRNSFPSIGTYGCVMNDHIYVVKYYPDRPGSIQKLTMEGEWVASFGYTYKSKNKFIASQISGGLGGRLACSERHGVIGLMLVRIPVLHGYSEDGELLWRVKFDGIRPPPIEERGRGRALYRRNTKGEGLGAYFFADGDEEHFGVLYFINAGRGQPTPWHYYRVDVQTGYGRYVGHAPFLRARSRDYVIEPSSHPYPTLNVFHFDGE